MKIAVGLSGGVDSAVTALKLLENGDEVIGVTMRLGRAGEDASVARTMAVAKQLGIDLKIYDFATEWHGQVIDYIRNDYLSGLTPNPCVRCNERVKFGLLGAKAFTELGCDYFATGHYAVAGGEGEIVRRGIFRAKDQSYFLYRVAPEILKRTLFPLGELTKTEVRAFATARGLMFPPGDDSQDFCGGDVFEIVGKADEAGEIVDLNGKVLGRHCGFWHYTPGMRRGLGIGGGVPYFVDSVRPSKNQVVVGFRELVAKKSVKIENCVFAADLDPEEPFTVKFRSAGEPRGPVTVRKINATEAEIQLQEPGMGIAPGQSAVIYRGEAVIAGGIIAHTA